ncbi:MAG: PhoH family protein, partial [Burkholderiales bacterium]
MPLPPAPNKRAAVLPAQAFDAFGKIPESPDASSLDIAAAPAATERTSRRGRAKQVQDSRSSAPAQQTAAPAVARRGGAAALFRDAPEQQQTPPAAAPLASAPLPSPSGVNRVRALAPMPAEPAPVAPPARAARPVARSDGQANDERKKSRVTDTRTRLFVLDTNVLLHDPTCLFRFEEHDVFLPMVVLEELDGHKKGMTEVARNGRQASRSLDALVGQPGADISTGLALNQTGHTQARGKLFFQTQPLEFKLPASLPQGKADNQILGVVEALGKLHSKREVVLVSKDINMRVKARALGLNAEDYESDKVLDDGDLLYTGTLALPHDFWTRQSKTVESWQSGSHTFYRITGPIVAELLINQFVYFEAPGEPSLFARVTEIRDKTAVLKTLKDYAHQKNSVWGVNARNREQNFALNVLMDPEIDFVTLTGTAGTGKTLMALAAGLTQVLDERRYSEIVMTRATVSVGEDIGFLPGTEEEKMGPWMGALDDNLEFLAKGEGGGSGGAGEWGRAATNELIRSKIKIKSMNFMRGRTFLAKYVIIDEAQNLTPKQMKTLVTRAGPGTKIVCMGNLAQIDTPYLTEG